MENPQVKYLKNYQPPSYWIDSSDLRFELYEDITKVKSFLKVSRNSSVANEISPLILDGKEMKLHSVSIDGNELYDSSYSVDEEHLIINKVPAEFVLEIETEIKPQENISLEGLYKSGTMFCTQCEAEGFRKITYFSDRPDVMSKYTVTIEADKDKYPVLLSNGNPVETADVENNRHYVKWKDPFKKPSYLFALVAGELVCVEDTYQTQSGCEVALKIYVESMNADKCDHTLTSLKKAMKWDEKVYGREYDLDIYMIVAVNDFNAGAMENKGLNIFNSKYVLAKTETATDTDFNDIERVIAHEYFHNWSGNRVTLQNWFQLSLKEGLTVFRDQCFTQDMTSKDVKRILDVRSLRAAQFPEDSGPIAHPVRPESYMEMNNFYTMTVYNKGAEVIRMIYRLLGKEDFRKGMDLYFEQFDGQAVTIEDFVEVMEAASGMDFKQFRLWYTQAGTPEITIERSYDSVYKTYTLTFRQHCPDTPGQMNKEPMHIPVAIGLLDKAGNDMPLQLQGEEHAKGTNRGLSLHEPKEIFIFTNIGEEPVPSILRGFSAPVKLSIEYSDKELAFLMSHDSDGFNRWEAVQKLFSNTILRLVKDYQENRRLSLDHMIVEAFKKVLESIEFDKSFIAQALMVPSESELGDLMEEIDVDAIHNVREYVIRTIALRLNVELTRTYFKNRDRGDYSIDQVSIGRRKLKNLALLYLSKIGLPSITDLVFKQFKNAANMTDEISAFAILIDIESEQRKQTIEMFYEKWKEDVLVLDKWFSVQALSQLPGTINLVNKLMEHKDFSIKNPNKVRSLIGTFCSGNLINFHTMNGYKFLADQILELDKINPMIAARMSTLFNKWKKYDLARKNLIKTQLERIINTQGLSRHVYEIVSKALV